MNVKLVSLPKERTYSESFWEQDVKNIWTWEKWSDSRMEKIV
jgi:hypothetical protein